MRMIQELKPDVLLVDPWLFGPAGLPGCLAAKQLRPRLVIVALLPDERDEYPRAARAVGANATIQKSRVARDLIPVLQNNLPLCA